MMRNTSCGRRRWGDCRALAFRGTRGRWREQCLAPRRIYACALLFTYICKVISPFSLFLPRGGFSFVLFWKSTKNFGLSFLRVSCRRGCLKRPLRASNLVGVSAAIPTAPPFTPQNPTAEIVARTPYCVVSRNGKVLETPMFCVREVWRESFPNTFAFPILM